MKKETALFLVALGIWLIAAPCTFDYKNPWMMGSDHLCGFLLIAMGISSVLWSRTIFFVLSALIGLWLQFAPLLFWAPEPVSYLNDTLVGMLALFLSFKGVMKGDVEGSCPKGWSFNPSDWLPRISTMFLAAICWFLARYLAAFQLRYIDHVWDPFFAGETTRVLSSSVARFFPVSDAGLGALGYSLEFFLGWVGGTGRWRSMPWIVVAFGLMVVPAGIVSITLIVLQPVIVGAWCGLCLVIAACMLIMILLTLPELIAVFQFLNTARKEKKVFWKVFWRGDIVENQKVQKSKKWSLSLGITPPWNLCGSALMGAWLMFAPFVLKAAPPFSDTGYVAGPLIITCSVIAFSEVARKLRYINIILGVGLVLSPWIVSGDFPSMMWNNIIVGILVVALAFRKGRIQEKYGLWDEYIK